MRDGHVNLLCRILAILVMVFLVAPLLIIIVVSFTPTAVITFPPQGFSMRWYTNIFTGTGKFMSGLVNSLKVGILAAMIFPILILLCLFKGNLGKETE